MKLFLPSAHTQRRGFTLMELLIVVSIILIIAVIFLLVSYRRSINRGRDAQRKADLVKIQRSFEEHYNDRNEYPASDILQDCGGPGLSPFLAKIPCDPNTSEPYLYQPDDVADLTLGYRVCAKLQDKHDPDIIAIGCDPDGCGWEDGYNYCLATGTSVTSNGFVPQITATPAPNPTPTPSYNGSYACRPGVISNGDIVSPGICNNVGDPAYYGCPWSFAESNCQNVCATQTSYWCAN